MKRVVFASVMGLALAGCDEASMASMGGGAGASGGSSGMREFLVIGNRMSFEKCRSLGGLIIRDQGSPMVACDPNVRGEPTPADEFNNPANNPGASDA